MKKIVLAAVLSISMFSCKQDSTYEYKYADQPKILACENIDAQLYSEAYYAFEKAIVTQAKNTNQRPNFNITPEYALRNYIIRSRSNTKTTDFITKEAFDIFNILKNEDIWKGIQLKNNSAVTECIGSSITNSQIKGAFNTLRSVESLNPNLAVSIITDDRSIRGQFKDKTLMTYAALDLYYARFFNADFSNIEFLVEKKIQNKKNLPIKIPSTKPEIGKKLNVTKAEKHGPHDGHNH